MGLDIAPIAAPAPISEFEEAEAPTSAFSFGAVLQTLF
jgi:hypothetical protein